MVDYLSFDDVMKELEVGEEDLKRMVSEGEIRAFRSENKMKFRKSDIETLRSGRMSEPTVILPAGEEPSPSGGEEPALDLDIDSEAQALTDDIDLEPSAPAPAPPPPPPKAAAPRKPAPPPAKKAPEPEPELELAEPESAAADADETVDLDVDDLTVAETAEEPEVVEEAEETFIEEGEETDTGAETAPLALAEDGEATEEETSVEEEAVEEEAAAPRRRRSVAAGMAPAAPPPSVGVFTFLLLLVTLVTAVLGVLVATGAMGFRNQVADGMANWRAETYWGNQMWHGGFSSRLPASHTDAVTGLRVPATAAEGPTFNRGADWQPAAPVPGQ